MMLPNPWGAPQVQSVESRWLQTKHVAVRGPVLGPFVIGGHRMYTKDHPRLLLAPRSALAPIA